MAFTEGNPTFYWYPDPAGTLERTQFGEGLQDIQELPAADVADAYDGEGKLFRVFFGVSQRFRVVLERFGAPGATDLERQLTSLQRHLFKGLPVGFSADHAKTWASLPSTFPDRGEATLYCTGSGFGAWSSAGTIAEGDEIVVESARPEDQLEVQIVDHLSVSPPAHVPIVDKVLYTYNQATLVRWRDFYPVCWLPKEHVGRPIVTHDHRMNYTLDLTLEYSPAAAIALWNGGEPIYAGGEALALPLLRDQGAGLSLGELLRRSRTRTPSNPLTNPSWRF